MAERAVTALEVQQNLQQLAQVCQTNFGQMSQNDKVLIDMAVTNTVNIRAIMFYLEDQGVDMKPYIDKALEDRKRQQEEFAKQEADLKRQAEEQLKAAREGQPEEPPPADPPPDEDTHLVFGGDFGEQKAPDSEEQVSAE